MALPIFSLTVPVTISNRLATTTNILGVFCAAKHANIVSIRLLLVVVVCRVDGRWCYIRTLHLDSLGEILSSSRAVVKNEGLLIICNCLPVLSSMTISDTETIVAICYVARHVTKSHTFL